MKLLSYHYETPKSPDRWSFTRFSLGNVNLLAGVSGVGKTRILNTIYNLSLIFQKKKIMGRGNWNINFEIDNIKYDYILHIDIDKDKKKNVVQKELLKKTKSKTNIIYRTKMKYLYKSRSQPKIPADEIALLLLRENNIIKPIYEGFVNILLRRWNPDYFSQIDTQLSIISNEVIETFKQEKLTIFEIRNRFKDVNTQLYLIEKYHPEIFKIIERDFIGVFPFVKSISVKDINDFPQITVNNIPASYFVPMLAITEENVNEDIPSTQISSGMLRTMIQLVDINTLSDGGIYLIDELENSLCPESLPVVVDLLKSQSNRIQLIFTTHLPKLFNSFNIDDWRILTREGSHVTVIEGKDIKGKFEKSNQDLYIQLLNSEMIEVGIK